MPRRKKKAHEQTTDEVLHRVFGKRVQKKLRELLLELDSQKPRKQKKRKP